MSNIKQAVTSQMIVMPKDEAPVQRVEKSALAVAVNRVKYLVQGGETMSYAQLATIAQEAILYRIVPGRDVHYWPGKQGGLERVYDYKYLKNFANFKEKLTSGDDAAMVEDTYTVLTDEEKLEHGVAESSIAARCRLLTRREREQFAEEVVRWKDIGLEAKEAVELARETYGELGTVAVGVVDPTEVDRWKKPVKPPKGWSFLQWAEKLAFKNAVNRKYGQPLADEMSAMAYAMAKSAQPEHWKEVRFDEPIDVQARLAELEAITVETEQESEDMTAEEHGDRLRGNIDVLRGDDVANKGDWLNEGPESESRQEEALDSPEPEEVVTIMIGDVKMALLDMGHRDHAQQMEYLIGEFGTGITFDTLTEEQKQAIVGQKEQDDE